MKNNYKKQSYKLNKFAEGGTVNSYLQAGIGALGTVTSSIGRLTPEQYTAQQFNAGSNDSLMAQAESYKAPVAHLDSVSGNTLSGAASGAQAGMAFGPLGAIIGGAAGGLLGGITTALGNNKEKEAAEKAKKEYYGNLAANAKAIQRTNMDNQLSNIAKYGGNISMNKFAAGGTQTNGVTTFNNGGTHEENPLGGIPQGIGANGLPNLVEEGEVKYKDYIFSDRLRAKQSTLAEVGLPNKYIGKTYGDIAKNLQKESAERPNDPISQKGLADMMQRLKTAQESTRTQKMKRMQSSQQPSQEEMMQMMTQQQEQTQPQEMAYGGNIYSGLEDFSSQMHIPWNTKQPDQNFNMTIPNQMFPMPKPNKPIVADDFLNFVSKGNYIPQTGDPNKFVDTSKIITQDDKKTTSNIFSNIDSSYLRYAPILASGLQAFSDQAGWTNKADSTLADTVSNQGVKATRLTDRMTYQPLDTRWLQNQANAQQAATRQAIIDQSGGNRAAAMAGLIGASYSGNLQAGQLARQEAEYNQAQRQKVFEFNRATNQYNADADRWEQSTNMQNKIQGAQLKEQTIQQAAAVRNANMNNFLNNITGLGQEAMTRNMITSNPALYYTIDNSGKVQYKQSDVAKYAKENNMTLVQAEEVIKNHAATNPNYKK